MRKYEFFVSLNLDNRKLAKKNLNKFSHILAMLNSGLFILYWLCCTLNGGIYTEYNNLQARGKLFDTNSNPGKTCREGLVRVGVIKNTRNRRI